MGRWTVNDGPQAGELSDFPQQWLAVLVLEESHGMMLDGSLVGKALPVAPSIADPFIETHNGFLVIEVACVHPFPIPDPLFVFDRSARRWAL